MALLFLLYFLLAISGAGLTARLRLQSLLDNVLMIFTLGAAQLLVSIQVLSLFTKLTPLGLLGANALTAAGVVWLTRRTAGEFWKSLYTGLKFHLAELRDFKSRGVATIFIAAAAIGILFQTVAAGVMYPMSDIYHFVMPLFWKQNQTILPFPAYDPRLIGVVFLSEALCLPGYLYAHTAATFALVSGVAALLAVGLVIAIARHIGAGVSASLCAGALFAGYGPMANSLLGAKADMLLSAVWFGASILFLLRTKSSLYSGSVFRLIACSVFCFCMACGAKNAVLLLVPVYGISMLLVCGRTLLSNTAMATVMVAGLVGLVVSGVIWSYASNLRWFGDPRGPQYLKDTLSQDFQPAAVWTRLARGTVMMASDVIWLPGSQQRRYGYLCERAVRLLGGRESISEDEGFYSFRAENIRPGTSFGLLGITMFVPSLVLAACVGLRFQRVRAWLASDKPVQDVGVLVALTLGSFVLYHMCLRWQTIGISRLMLPCLMAGAPLAGLILGKKWLRLPALPLFLGVMFVYSVFGFGLAARRLAASETSGLTARISKLQRSHSITVEWKWRDAPAEKQEVKEGYTKREIVRALLKRLPQPTTFGFIGKNTSEGYYLFGDDFSNKVVSLTDCRGTDRYLTPPAEVQFLVAEDFEPSDIPREIIEGFDPLVTIERDGRTVLAVFKRSEARTISAIKPEK